MNTNSNAKNIFIKISIAVLLVLCISMCIAFVVNSDREAEAALSPSKGDLYTNIKINIQGAGYVEAKRYDGIKTITSFPTLFASGDTLADGLISWTAVPNAGYKFVKWTYSDSTSYTNSPQNEQENNTSYEQTLSISRSARTDITVYFEISTYTVTVNSANTNQGTVSGGGSVNVGSSTTVTATPKTGYAFLNWTNSSGSVLSTNASYTFTPTGNTTLTANFIAQYTVTVTSANTNQGTVSGGKTVTAGTSVTVTATPKTGYAFKNWTNGSTVVSTNASYTFTPTANTTLTANFIALYTVTVQSANTNQGTVSGGKTITAGSGLTVTATPKTGYIFKNWTNASGSIVSTNASYTFTPTASITLTANFVAQYTVTVNSADSNKGTVSGGKTVTAGNSVTVTATPKSGYMFRNWTNASGTVVSTSASYTFTPTANITLTANFDKSLVIHNGSGYITTFSHSYDESNFQLILIIKPTAGQYINEISFDNKTYQALDSWEANLYIPCTFALTARYAINTGTNKLGLTLNYCEFDQGIDIYVHTVSTPYSGLKKPSSAVEQIAVTATKGGSVLLIGDDYDDLGDNDQITCIAKVASANYEFAGWYFASDLETAISTDESVKFMKKDIYEQQIIAKFVYVEPSDLTGSSDMNFILDNCSNL